jgi:hypothetical protein
MTVQNQSESQTKETKSETPIVPTKKEFVEPELSQPVDVLEATAFFQTVDSGATN